MPSVSIMTIAVVDSKSRIISICSSRISFSTSIRTDSSSFTILAFLNSIFPLRENFKNPVIIFVIRLISYITEFKSDVSWPSVLRSIKRDWVWPEIMFSGYKNFMTNPGNKSPYSCKFLGCDYLLLGVFEFSN